MELKPDPSGYLMCLLADGLNEKDVVVVEKDVTPLTTGPEEVDLTGLVVVLYAEHLEQNSICLQITTAKPRPGLWLS
jgi:hypothetical protein